MLQHKNLFELKQLQNCTWLRDEWLTMAARVRCRAEAIQKGDIYLAVEESKYAGHSHIDRALAAGAGTIIAEKGSTPAEFHQHEKVVFVPSSRVTLFALARHARSQTLADWVAITGSNGKTTCKELLHFVLSQFQNSLATQANLNTKCGIAQMALQANPAHDSVVVEMGAREHLDLGIPLEMARPTISVCLNIGSAHIGVFGSKENQIQTKTSIYRPESVETCVVNIDQPDVMQGALAAARAGEHGKNIVTFGKNARADVRIIETDMNSVVILQAGGRRWWFRPRYNSAGLNYTIAAVACVLQAMWIPDAMQRLQQAVREFELPEGRSSMSLVRGKTVVNDAFNASPESMRSSVSSFLRQFAKSPRKRTLVLGDMLELGEHSRKFHRDILAELVELQRCSKTAFELILIGEQFDNAAREVSKKLGEQAGRLLVGQAQSGKQRSADGALMTFPDVDAALAQRHYWLDKAEILFFKASRSLGLNRIIAKI